MADLDKKYWNDRYLQNNFPWDAGAITSPLKAYFDQLETKHDRILIPGAGNAYEAAYLFESGFTDVYVCDWAEAPLQQFQTQNPKFPKEQLIISDFFQLAQRFDLIVEQTFFCTLATTEQRASYAQKMAELLHPGGKLIGLLFENIGIPDGPPFDGTQAEYFHLFSKYFKKVKIEPCYNSIKPRAGKELFIQIEAPYSMNYLKS